PEQATPICPNIAALAVLGKFVQLRCRPLIVAMGTAGETACPTLLDQSFGEVGGAGGFACRWKLTSIARPNPSDIRPTSRQAEFPEFLGKRKGSGGAAPCTRQLQLVVGGKYLRKVDSDMPLSTFKHDRDLVVRPLSRQPIIFGMPEFHLIDETYKGMWIAPDVYG